VGYHLSAKNRRMLWIPAGLAHGFVALGEWNEVHYKATDFWAPQFERSVLWDDPALGIEWPLDGAEPILSNKDRAGLPLAQAEVYYQQVSTS
jgi:dTDP-4-dehydrorhamnose 3,5-epimerase